VFVCVYVWVCVYVSVCVHVFVCVCVRARVLRSANPQLSVSLNGLGLVLFGKLQKAECFQHGEVELWLLIQIGFNKHVLHQCMLTSRG